MESKLEVVNAIINKASRSPIRPVFVLGIGGSFAFVFERSHEGVSIENLLSWEVRSKFYPNEYKLKKVKCGTGGNTRLPTSLLCHLLLN